jgi:osmotically-inducible protein OsmY
MDLENNWSLSLRGIIMSERLSLITLTLTIGLMLLTNIARAEPGTTGSPVENTGRNARDKSNTTLTPVDQFENDVDLEITASIRKAVTNDTLLSVDAHNAKIITRNGSVTLRGPVETEAEKIKLHTIAKQTPEVTKVDDQLEVKKAP